MPRQKVPYFRAPNGSWGVTGEVAAALGMQPLGLGNVIFDWDGNDLSEETLTKNLRAAIQPGAVALVHDGGDNRENSIKAVETVLPEKIAEGYAFTLPAGGIPGGEVVLSTSFEDGLDGWEPRGDARVTPRSPSRRRMPTPARTRPWSATAPARATASPTTRPASCSRVSPTRSPRG